MDVVSTADANPHNVQDLTVFVQGVMQQMQDKFKTIKCELCMSLTIAILDDMGNRIDDLERNIADLMTQAGVEEK
ncbi:HSBP1 [Bugula neritina]|uniref:HSBP1 n=1 Tax=Bugula neritina TaxID=10212 RepID=A0A7J7KD39_BUGNE|nr:HSBP1 [Bugula neritina]